MVLKAIVKKGDSLYFRCIAYMWATSQVSATGHHAWKNVVLPEGVYRFRYKYRTQIIIIILEAKGGKKERKKEKKQKIVDTSETSRIRCQACSGRIKNKKKN